LIRYYKILLVFLINFLAVQSAFSQYTERDSALVSTVFERSFDKEIIRDYLESKESRRVIAGLLAAAHSADTLFIPTIVDLDFSFYGKIHLFRP